MKTRKIGIIGVGHVGAHCAYSLAVQGIADELVLVDKNEKKAASECQDLRDSAAYLPHRVSVQKMHFGAGWRFCRIGRLRYHYQQRG